MRSFTIIFAVFFLVFINPAYAYVLHDPIVLEGIQGTADDPYIIEGYDISNPHGDCIKITNSMHVIIKNNYLHNCGSDEVFQEQTDHYQEGYATLIGDSSDITFENNKLNNNFRGFMAYNTPRLKALNNDIRNTTEYSPLWCERCNNSEFAFNYLSDNGDPEGFWVPSTRSIGIWIKRSDDVDIHDNTIIRSTSDGISVTGVIWGPSFTVPGIPDWNGPQMNWDGFASNINIYNNLILDNMEQGVWMLRARNIKIFNNTIRTGCFTNGGVISTEFDVADSEFFNNKLLTCFSGPPGGWNSYNNYYHDNTYYSFTGDFHEFMYYESQNAGAGISGDADRQGIAYSQSRNNTEENNKWILIGGTLAEEMKEKKEYAEKHKTYEWKGWWVCLKEDNSVDLECQEREEAKGKQGMPREELHYSSLMEDFDAFAVPEEIYEEEEHSDAFVIEEPEAMPEQQEQSSKDKGLVPLFSLFILIALIIVIFKYRKFKNNKFGY